MSQPSASRGTLAFCVMGALNLALSGAASAEVVGGVGDGGFEDILGMLNLWTNMLAVFVTAVIGVGAFQLYANYRQAEKLETELRQSKRDLMDSVTRDIQRLKEDYGLHALKPPMEILAEARRDYETVVGGLRAGLEHEMRTVEERFLANQGAIEALEQQMAKGIAGVSEQLERRSRVELEKVLEEKLTERLGIYEAFVRSSISTLGTQDSLSQSDKSVPKEISEEAGSGDGGTRQ